MSVENNVGESGEGSREFSSIDEVTRLLASVKGKSFREIDRTGRLGKAGNKGSLGSVLEESVLGYHINSDPEPDIIAGGVPWELKATPLRHAVRVSKRPGGFDLRAKERLVIDIINYMDLPAEVFDDSTFWHKAKNIIIVYYIDDRKDRKAEAREDCRIHSVVLLDYRDAELATIREDWQFIHDKVASGHADALSESDTNYLAASTKGATAKSSYRDAPAPVGSGEETIRAKQRAFSYKPSYMSMVAERLLGRGTGERLQMDADQSLTSYVEELTGRYVGMTCRQIAASIPGYRLPQKAGKAFRADLLRLMLGVHGDVDKVEQFKAAGVTQVKVVERFAGGGKSGRALPKQDMSFRAITPEQWRELADPGVGWQDSFMYTFFEENRMLVCSFRNSGTATHPADSLDDVFEGSFLWNMPEGDIDRYVRPVWERVHELMVAGGSLHYGESRGSNLLPGKEFNGVCHFRPHARDSKDRVELPNGESIPKQAFWLDRRYIGWIIGDRLDG